jgi:hypothetical protein
MKPAIRQWLLRAVAVGLGLIATLLVCETVLRIQEPFFHIVGAAPGDMFPPLTTNRVWDHWVLPHTSVTLSFHMPDLYPKPFIYSTNNFGCRYLKDLTVPKPAGIRRILVLGDSFAEGFYFEDTVANRLETRLNQTAQGVRYEVVNCACSSYSPLLEYLRLKNQLIQMQPDEIILAIDQTDIFDDYWRYRPRTRFAADGDPVATGENLPWQRQAILWAKQNSYLVPFLSKIQWSFAARFGSSRRTTDVAGPVWVPIGRNVFRYFSTLPVESEDWQREVGFCLGNISRIIRFTRERRILLTVTMYPHRQQLEPDPGERLWNREFEHSVEQLCKENGVRFYDAFDGIASAYHANRAIYWEHNMHFSPAGQRVWADLVADYYAKVESEAIVPTTTSAASRTR